MAAKYYRLAEENGSKTLGNTWCEDIHPSGLGSQANNRFLQDMEREI